MSSEINKIKNDFEKVKFENGQLKEHLLKTMSEQKKQFDN